MQYVLSPSHRISPSPPFGLVTSAEYSSARSNYSCWVFCGLDVFIFELGLHARNKVLTTKVGWPNGLCARLGDPGLSPDIVLCS